VPSANCRNFNLFGSISFGEDHVATRKLVHRVDVNVDVDGLLRAT
jgi:hypothetical protein